jgi:proteasome lid subunit RPN8/RPN11
MSSYYSCFANEAGSTWTKAQSLQSARPQGFGLLRQALFHSPRLPSPLLSPDDREGQINKRPRYLVLCVKRNSEQMIQGLSARASGF